MFAIKKRPVQVLEDPASDIEVGGEVVGEVVYEEDYEKFFATITIEGEKHGGIITACQSGVTQVEAITNAVVVVNRKLDMLNKAATNLNQHMMIGDEFDEVLSNKA